MNSFRWDNRRGGFFLSQVPLRVRPSLGQTMTLPPEMTAEAWEEKNALLEGEWEASGRTILRGLAAIVDDQFRQHCWYPNGNRGQQSGSLEMVTRSGYITCEDNWARICTVPEAEGGSAGNPGCPVVEPEPEPEPTPEPAPDTGNGDDGGTVVIVPPPGAPPAEEPPPTPEPAPLPVEDDALTTALTAGGLLAALTGLGILIGR